MGASNVAAVHTAWRTGLPYKARLLLSHMANVSIDADDPPVYVESWAERARFLLGDDAVPRTSTTPQANRARKRAWQCQDEAVKQLIAAEAIVRGTCRHNTNKYAREGFALNIFRVPLSRKILDANPGKSWTFSREILDAVQENPWIRNQEDPLEANSGFNSDPFAPQPQEAAKPGRKRTCEICNGAKFTVEGDCVRLDHHITAESRTA